MTDATTLYLGRPPSPVAARRLPFFFLFFFFFFAAGFICSDSSGGSFSSLCTEPHSDEARRGAQANCRDCGGGGGVDVVTHEVRPSGPTTLAQPQITIDDFP